MSSVHESHLLPKFLPPSVLQTPNHLEAYPCSLLTCLPESSCKVHLTDLRFQLVSLLLNNDIVHEEDKNDSYDSTLTEVASYGFIFVFLLIGIENSRKTYNELTSLVNSMTEKVENNIPMETGIDDVSHISYNSLDFNLDLLDSVYLEKRENDSHFLQSLRTTMKKVRSADTTPVVFVF